MRTPWKRAAALIDAVTIKGDVDLGNLTQTTRFSEVLVPLTGSFRAGLKDTIIRRYLHPIPGDTSHDSVTIKAIVQDSAGNKDSTLRKLAMVSGPKLTIVAPTAGDSVSVTVSMGISVRGQHVLGEGIEFIGFRATNSAGAVVIRDSIHLSTPFTANVQRGVPLNLKDSLKFQGQTLGITTFARDQSGRIGYAVRSSQLQADTNL